MNTKNTKSITQNILDDILAEISHLEEQLADPLTHSDQKTVRAVTKRHAQIMPIAVAARQKKQAEEDYQAALELAHADKTFAAEAEELQQKIVELEATLYNLLAPRDPHDADDIVLEIKSGEGGEESALFAADLARMYLRYAESRGWKVETLELAQSDLGGYKDATFSIRSQEPVDGVWSHLKFEGGVHRVQRIPVTETQGRVHTSAAGVLVYPEPEEVEQITIDEADLRVDVYRSSGKGGQGVNTTDSAVRLTHLPTGIVVTCQNERSQMQNKARAMQVLAARLQVIAEEQAEKAASDGRAQQIRTVDRSERIRTYNFPENRITDHRIGFKAHNLDVVLNGHLEAMITALQSAHREERLHEEELERS